MVLPSKDKKVAADYSKLAGKKVVRKKRKPSSILQSKKFFLHFKNLSLQTKYECQLKTFGAEIIPYIDREVNYVLTDSLGYNGKSLAVTEVASIVSPQCYSVSPAASVSGDDQGTVRRTRTRTEAMLERVSVQSHSVSTLNNPIITALSWNIPVYSVDYFQNLLNKKLCQIQLAPSNEKDKEGTVREFYKKYLKIEHLFVNKYRPEFKEVHHWPTIDTNSVLGSCPFDKLSRKSIRKEKLYDNEKATDRMNRTCNKTANEAGYCEICTVHYSDLSQHVTTSSHLKFICNDKNYAELDKCIKTRSIEAFLATHFRRRDQRMGNVLENCQNNSNDSSCEKEFRTNDEMGRNLKKSVSLHLNNNNENSSVSRSLNNAKLLAEDTLKQPLQVQCNGFTNYHLRKSSIKSDSVLMTSPHMLNNKDLLQESRKMYSTCPESNSMSVKDMSQLSPFEEDNSHRLRSRKNLLLPSILLGTTAEDSNKGRNGLSPQTPTSNHFLRSSSSPKSHFGGSHHSTRSRLPAEDSYKKLNMPDSPTSNKNSLGLHFTRSKTSNHVPYESKRSSRAASSSPRDESRMNGKPCKRKSSINVSDEETKINSAPASSRNVPSYQFSKKLRNNLANELADMNDKIGHRKRMSVEEKFLEDNKEYYKVELLRTKLRSTEYYCSRETSPVGRREEKREPKKEEDSDEAGNRLKRQRQSALHLLNMEATNFMFGPSKRDGSRSSEGEDCDSKHEDEEDGMNHEDGNQSQHPSCSDLKENCRRMKGKKRRTHAEVFIHDNLDYYKFEISGSRLRHQNNEELTAVVKTEPGSKNNCSSSHIPSTNLQDVASRVKEEVTTDDETDPTANTCKRGKTRRTTSVEDADTTTCAKEESEAEETDVENQCCDRPPPPADSVRFAFESIPHKELWYQAFQRFDQCEERYIPISDTVYFSRYRDILPRCRSRKRNTDKNTPKASPLKDSNALAHFRRKRKQRFGRHIIDDKPRKSPRCHASTLAILSSLTGYRRRSRKLQLPLATSPRKSIIANKTDLELKSLLLDVSQELEVRLKDTADLDLVAKEVDYHLMEVFSNDDCGDAYLNLINSNKDNLLTIENSKDPTHCCLQIDTDILHDEELLKSLMDSASCIDNMAEFLDNSQQCTSMETAQDEELILPRSHDMLSRLYRENDFSGNSSDCGASSTCEFLGFAEDGRTVSRKRKRKKPNLTGWPHDKSKRRQLRMNMVDILGQDNANSKLKDVDNEASEADSDASEDDIMLSEFITRKKRHTNNSLSAGEIDPKEQSKYERKKCMGDSVSPRKSSRMSAVSSHVNSRKLTPRTRRKSSAISSGRRTKCI